MAKSLQHYIYNNEVRMDSNRIGSLAACSSVSLFDVFLTDLDFGPLFFLPFVQGQFLFFCFAMNWSKNDSKRPVNRKISYLWWTSTRVLRCYGNPKLPDIETFVEHHGLPWGSERWQLLTPPGWTQRSRKKQIIDNFVRKNHFRITFSVKWSYCSGLYILLWTHFFRTSTLKTLIVTLSSWHNTESFISLFTFSLSFFLFHKALCKFFSSLLANKKLKRN